MFVDAVRELGREAERERERERAGNRKLWWWLFPPCREEVCMVCVDTRKRERGCLSQTVARLFFKKHVHGSEGGTDNHSTKSF